MRSVIRAATVLLTALFRARHALINPLLVALLGFGMFSAARAQDAAQPAPAKVSADVSGYTDKGYGRLLLTFSEEIKAKVRVENGIIIVEFGRPILISTDKLKDRLTGYVQAVRRDPDGSAVRLALSQKVTVNVMEAAERLYVDMLPANWVGLPPSLPTEVVDELARRARDAEKQAMMNRKGPPKVWAPVKLRYATAPTFARFSFELSEPVGIASQRDGQELRISFDAPVKVDFGEALARLPREVASLNADYQADATVVKLVLTPGAELRTFHEDASFIADVMPASAQMPQDVESNTKAEVPAAKTDAATEPAPAQELATVAPTPPQTVPAAPAPKAGASEKPMAEKPVAEKVAIVEKPIEPVPVANPAPALTEPVYAEVTRSGGKLTVNLPFHEPVSGAFFQRGDFVWAVIDSVRPLSLSEIANDPTHFVQSYEQIALPKGQLVRFKIDRSRLAGLDVNDDGWMIQLGGVMTNPSRPIPARRVFAGQNRAGVLMPIGQTGHAYNLKDPEIGDDLLVITAPAPVRGLVRGQSFIDFDALASVHGVVIAPRADDLAVELSPEGVTITRPEGLSVSDMQSVLPSLPEKAKATGQITTLDPEAWKDEQQTNFLDREMDLSRLVSEAPIVQRANARVSMARFYLANDMTASAIGVLDAASEDETKYGSDSSRALLHGLAELILGRPDIAYRDFNNPVLVKSPQAALLRASALSQQSKWGEARDQFNAGKGSVATLPVEVQRMILIDALRAMISSSDYAQAADIRSQLELVGIPDDMKPIAAILSARLAVGLGRGDQAATDYADIAAGPEGPAMAEARLRLVEMKMNKGDLDRARAIEALETLSFAWRGDETEVETMRALGKLYVAESRYRDAFNLVDAAAQVRPNSEVTRGFYNEMATTFEDLFLSERAGSVEPVEALAIYYDFSKLTPIGRRGDELIRRLADRLVSVDLLDQASDLLDYQVKYRLTGVAKAQVAAKLAWVDLLNSKPAAAVQALATTRMNDMPQDLRDQRLLLEARSMSELGRYDAALELAAGMNGVEADRLRGDILWSAKRWREAGEAFETLLGQRWQNPAQLNETERRDVLRAAIAFSLGNETVGLTRLRDRYSAKMPDGQERTALGIVVSSSSGSPKMIGDVAKTLSAVDSLKLFLKLYQARFPDKPLPADTADATPRKVSER